EVSSTVLGGMIALSGTPTIAAPTKPDLFAASGNDGQYSYSYPLSVVPGPDGFMPQLALSYSSLGTNERYSAVSPAGDEGDGWSLSMGSISATTSDPTSTGGAQTWYSINGVAGISDKLIPNPAGQTTYYETEHISHLRIKNAGTYWEVWGLDGTWYEFGDTNDSLQKTSAGTYEWDLDAVMAPTNSTSQVKAMFIRYYQDSPSSGTIRDAGIDSIQYGFTNSTSATTLTQTAGTVDFYYHAPHSSTDSDGQGKLYATAYGTNYHCSSPPSNTTMRCDDPVTYNSVAPPTVMPTLTLDTVTSFVGTDTSNSNKAYRYNFTYQDTPYTTSYYDPYTFTQQAAAGEHLLTQITPE